VPVELNDVCHAALEGLSAKPSLREKLGEELFGLELPHPIELLAYFSWGTERDSCGALIYRLHRVVDLRSVAPIQEHLTFAKILTALEGRVIEKFQMQGLLELVCPNSSQEYMRDMRLNVLNAGNGWSKGVGHKQSCD